MARVTHFEIRAEVPERAVKFYQQDLSWNITKQNRQLDYWMANTGPEDRVGIDGAIMRHNERLSSPITNVVEVDSLDACSEKILAAKAPLVQPKVAIPGVVYQAYFKDTEGNLFGIHQSDRYAR